MLLAPGNGRRDALVLEAQLPPRLVVFLRRHFSREDLPAPLVDQQTERQEGDLLQRLLEQQADVFGRIRRLLQKSELRKILRRDRQRDGVADRFMEAVIGAVPEKERLLVVGSLVEIVPQ